MNGGLALLGGFGLGAGLMYLLDPRYGRRRRALLRDQGVRLLHETGAGLELGSRDLLNRSRGVLAESKHLFNSEPVDDRRLIERVRSKLGRLVSHTESIQVSADNGKVTLSGPILAHEVNALLDGVRGTHGVRAVENRLEIHRQRGNIPSLQGGAVPPGEHLDLMRSSWSPATRLLALVGGGSLLAYGATCRAPVSCLLGTLGLGVALRGLTNLETRRLLGVGCGRRAVDIQKTITIHAPIDEVFAFWTHPENFARFMSHVQEVRPNGVGRTHWIVTGPAGLTVSWDAQVTQYLPNQVLAWKSLPGSVIPNAGIIRFEDLGEPGTRINLRLSYNPPAGALGHFAARFFGADAKSALDEDLVRLKSLLEEGKASAPGGKRARLEELANARPAAPVLQ